MLMYFWNNANVISFKHEIIKYELPHNNELSYDFELAFLLYIQGTIIVSGLPKKPEEPLGLFNFTAQPKFKWTSS